MRREGGVVQSLLCRLRARGAVSAGSPEHTLVREALMRAYRAGLRGREIEIRKPRPGGFVILPDEG